MKHCAKWLALAVTLAIMLALFCLSAQPAAASSVLSEDINDSLQGTPLQLFVPGWFSPNMYANIRKWAHVYVYALLGISCTATAVLWLPHTGLEHQFCLCVAVCAAYAASDEFHQLFVPGRAGLVSDVFIDACGFVPAIALALVWVHCRHRAAHRRKAPEHD